MPHSHTTSDGAAVPSKAPNTTALLTHEQIDEADDLPEFDLPIPDWNGSVRLRGLSYDQLAVCRQHAWNTRKKETDEDVLNAWCLSLGVVTPATSFTQAKAWIIKKKFGPVNTILSEILKASGLGAAAVDEAKSEADRELAEPAL
jgi:hypothetical protein